MMSRAIVPLVLVTGLSFVGPTVQAQTLAAASEAAKQIPHEWPVSPNAVPAFDPAKAVPVTSDVVPASVVPDATIAAAPLVKTEPYWKGRMRDVRTALENDQTLLAAAVALEHTLDLKLHHPSAMDPIAIRDSRERSVVDAWQYATADVSRLTALVQIDTRKVGDLELEARRAGALPGWLVLE